MSPFDDFIHISTSASTSPDPSPEAPDWSISSSVPQTYFDNAKGLCVNTEALLVASIRKNHPHHFLTVTHQADFIGLANSRDDITCNPSTSHNAQTLLERFYLPPARRLGDEEQRLGRFGSNVVFGCFEYHFEGTDFILYVVLGMVGLYQTMVNYVLTPIEKRSSSSSSNEEETKSTTGKTKLEGEAAAQRKADNLLATAVKWGEELHNEVLVFDEGYWQKNKELYDNIQKSNWEDVILRKERKEAIITDVIGFFNSAERYTEFGVPWKRGVIFYGPPGNGKTISTKALMHDVSKRTSPTVNSLYVKTFNTWQGPEYGIRLIFEKARQMAPCLLIFEDIDSLVGPGVRSYFLNEVDGLESNQGILMIGSTNHLERLDPGIAKRPSRFDRKYFFDVPDEGERVQYAEYWRHKLRDNKKVDFPEVLCEKVAGITADFSFAYMKEAFVAALLVIAGNGVEGEEKMKKKRGSAGAYDQHHENDEGGDDDDLKDNPFWQELQRQVTNLRKEMEHEGEDTVTTTARGGGLTSHLLRPPPPPPPPFLSSSSSDLPGGSFSGRYSGRLPPVRLPVREGPSRGREQHQQHHHHHQKRRPGEGGPLGRTTNNTIPRFFRYDC